MKIVTINKIKYNYIYCDLIELLKFLKINNNYTRCFLNLMRIHRNKNFEIFHLVLENDRELKKNIKTKFLIIYNEKDIVSFSRLNYTTKIGYISMVHTNLNYRGKKICQGNIKKLINLSKKNLKEFELYVLQNNISAIKCYERCKFVVSKEIICENEQYYKMILSLKN